MGELSIYIEEEKQTPAGTLGGTPHGGKEKTNIGSISAEKLRDSITALSDEFAHIMQDVKKVGGFKLKEVQIQAGVDAQAGIVLIGKAGIKGTVTLTFAEE